MTASYPYLQNARGHTLDYREMRRAAGVPEEHIERMPAWLSRSRTFFDGVALTVMGTQEAKNFWNNPGTNTPMRVIAECPQCGKIVAASRINQHARVHNGGVRRGY